MNYPIRNKTWIHGHLKNTQLDVMIKCRSLKYRREPHGCINTAITDDPILKELYKSYFR